MGGAAAGHQQCLLFCVMHESWGRGCRQQHQLCAYPGLISTRFVRTLGSLAPSGLCWRCGARLGPLWRRGTPGQGKQLQPDSAAACTRISTMGSGELPGQQHPSAAMQHGEHVTAAGQAQSQTLQVVGALESLVKFRAHSPAEASGAYHTCAGGGVRAQQTPW